MSKRDERSPVTVFATPVLETAAVGKRVPIPKKIGEGGALTLGLLRGVEHEGRFRRLHGAELIFLPGEGTPVDTDGWGSETRKWTLQADEIAYLSRAESMPVLGLLSPTKMPLPRPAMPASDEIVDATTSIPRGGNGFKEYAQVQLSIPASASNVRIETHMWNKPWPDGPDYGNDTFPRPCPYDGREAPIGWAQAERLTIDKHPSHHVYAVWFVNWKSDKTRYGCLRVIYTP